MREAQSTPHEPGRPLVLAVVLLSVATTAWLALAGRGNVLLYGDEYLSVSDLGASYWKTLSMYDHRGTGVAFLLLQKLAVDLLGESLFAYRSPAILGGIGAVLVAYPTAKRLVGAWPALIATPLLATTSQFVYYARFGRAYALLVLLVLLFAGALQRVLDDERPRRRTLALVAVSGGLLPWVHLTAAAPVALVGLAALVVVVLRRDRARFVRLAGSLFGAALLALLLFLPAWEPALEFVRTKTGGSSMNFGVLHVASLLPGSEAVGTAWAVLVPIAALWFALRHRGDAVVTLVAALAPVLGVLLTKPAGGVYAFARYLIAALPFYAMLLAWLLVRCAHLVPVGRSVAERSAAAVGIALTAVVFLTGPIVTDAAARGPFANTNMSLHSLAPFDVPFDEMPAFYAQLAASPEPLSIVEIPEQVSRSVLLYRNYWLAHRKDVLIGYVLARKNAHVPAGPYLRIGVEGLRDLDADYVILHKAIDLEMLAYWRFVHGKVWSELEDPDLFPHMQAHGNFGTRFQAKEVALEGLAALGAPFYTDDYLIVWKLR